VFRPLLNTVCAIVFDLPHEILVTLHQRDAAPQSLSSSPSATPASRDGSSLGPDNKDEGTVAASTSCALCDVKSLNVLEQRGHVRSDLHKYNLKQRLKGLKTVGETEFDKLIGGIAAHRHSPSESRLIIRDRSG
jgi:hypothetical protein